VARVEIRVEAKREGDAGASGRRRKPNRRRTEREEGEIGFPKDLCAILENCRDLSVKHNFSSI
jgi:hypothetical protein